MLSILPSSAGILPVKPASGCSSLACWSSLSHSRLSRLPRSAGIEPANRLLCAQNRVRLLAPPNPSSRLVNSLSSTLNSTRFVRFPSPPGTMPPRLFPCRYRISSASRPPNPPGIMPLRFCLWSRSWTTRAVCPSPPSTTPVQSQIKVSSDQFRLPTPLNSSLAPIRVSQSFVTPTTSSPVAINSYEQPGYCPRP